MFPHGFTHRGPGTFGEVEEEERALSRGEGERGKKGRVGSGDTWEGGGERLRGKGWKCEKEEVLKMGLRRQESEIGCASEGEKLGYWVR